MAETLAKISQMCGLLVAWLTLRAHVSRATANTVLQVLQLILMVTIQFFALGLQSIGISIEIPHIRIPHDVRTIYSQQGLTPGIVRTVCCPKCFWLYPDDENLPSTCTRRRKPRAHMCRANLQRQKLTSSGIKNIPIRYYNTQTFESWLQFFLGRPSTENYLDQCYNHIPSQGKMKGIWDSPIWKSLGNFCYTRGKLVFGLYIDWFNPYTNKIAG